MKTKNICLSICLALEVALLCGCTVNNAKDAADSIEQFGKDVADQLENFTDADDPNVLVIKRRKIIWQKHKLLFWVCQEQGKLVTF